MLLKQVTKSCIAEVWGTTAPQNGDCSGQERGWFWCRVLSGHILTFFSSDNQALCGLSHNCRSGLGRTSLTSLSKRLCVKRCISCSSLQIRDAYKLSVQILRIEKSKLMDTAMCSNQTVAVRNRTFIVLAASNLIWLSVHVIDVNFYSMRIKVLIYTVSKPLQYLKLTAQDAIHWVRKSDRHMHVFQVVCLLWFTLVYSTHVHCFEYTKVIIWVGVNIHSRCYQLNTTTI